MFFDTHAHFETFEEAGTTADILARAQAVGVSHICAVGSSNASNDLCIRLTKQYAGQIVAAVGYDRSQANVPYDIAILKEHIAQPEVVAVGEIGLDYFYEPESATQQRQLLEHMLDLALETGHPVILHCREAEADMRALLEPFSTAWKMRYPHHPPGVLHCYTGGMEFAKWLVQFGFFISFSGIVTFQNANSLREVAQWVPQNSLVVETDCPYLTPKPFRGKMNEPAYVVRVAEMLAELRKIPLSAMADISRKNAERLFQMDERIDV